MLLTEAVASRSPSSESKPMQLLGYTLTGLFIALMIVGGLFALVGIVVVLTFAVWILWVILEAVILLAFGML